jgi:hypothetical protein
MPFSFLPAPQMQMIPQMQQPRMNQPQPRSGSPVSRNGNGRYLPAMPEMLSARTRQTPPPRSNPQSNAALASGKGTGSQVIIRGQGNEEPTNVPLAKLSIPAPEELGLVSPFESSPSAMDWAGAKAKLEKLGASHYRLEKAERGWCFVCSLSHPQQPAVQRQFEAHAATEPEAIHSLLQQVDEWHAAPK